MQSDSNRSISLVLGSGGARGLAHIGAIRWLEANGYQIRSISGCSMGALIGGIFAIGRLQEFEDWVRAVSKRDIFSLLDLSLNSSGLFKGDKIIETLKGLVGEAQIENLPITYTAVAAELESGTEVWLNRGPLFDAIRASISIPLFFTPVDYRGNQLVDGGILNPVPIAPTFGDQTELTIAVDINGAIDHSHLLEQPEVEHKEPSSSLQKRIKSYITSLQTRATEALTADFEMLDIATQSFEAMQSAITRQKLAAYPPDVTIEISRDACRILEFHRAQELINLGYQVTAQQIAQYHAKL